MGNIYNELLYRPLLNALIYFYNTIPFHDFGVAVILLTIFIRIVLLPLFYKGAKDQAIMQRLAPKLKELQQKHKGDREAHAKAMFALYREHKVNPMTGFLLLLVQFPILIALYQVFLNGFSAEQLLRLYSFVARPDVINPTFLGIVNLSAMSVSLIALAGLSQYAVGWITMLPNKGKAVSADDFGGQMQKQMLYMGPVFIVLALYFFKAPAIVALYWLTTNLFSVIQQVVINRRLKESDI